MARIRFTVDPKLPRDLAHLGYKAGQEHDLPDDEVERWLRRGVAEVISDKPTKRGGGKATPATAPATKLLGVAGAPEVVDLGKSTLPFADLVAAAHKRSGLTVEAWNALPETGGPDSREGLLRAEVEDLRKAAASA